MYKIIGFIKRLPGLSPEEFRNYYETTGQNFVTHIQPYILKYTRSYPTSKFDGVVGAFHSASGVNGYNDYDAITEVWIETAELVEKVFQAMPRDEIQTGWKNYIDETSYQVLVFEEEVTPLERFAPA